MAYSDQALLSNDGDFLQRIAAAAAVEVDLPEGTHPLTWAAEHQWFLAAAPGFADKYAYALAMNNPRPGWDASVIPDLDILSAIQAMTAP